MHNQKNLKSERLRWNHRSVSSCTVHRHIPCRHAGFSFPRNPLLPHPAIDIVTAATSTAANAFFFIVPLSLSIQETCRDSFPLHFKF